MSNAILRIMQERQEQVIKHGFGDDHDNQYFNDELLSAALFSMTLDAKYYPPDWHTKWAIKIEEKRIVDRLAVAGAFLVAHMELLERRENSRRDQDGTPPEGESVAGTFCVNCNNSPCLCNGVEFLINGGQRTIVQKGNRIGRSGIDMAERISAYIMAESLRWFQKEGPGSVGVALELRELSKKIGKIIQDEYPCNSAG